MVIMEGVPSWQLISLTSILVWIFLSSYLGLTLRLRSLLQPPITGRVVAGIPLLLRIQQRLQHSWLDFFFSVLSCIVSVPFYTAFLPILFWSGHSRLARQMTLLMAFCDYSGNCVKDLVSAPRPSAPLLRRITATKDEEENAMEYGLPSSHTLNTVCLSGFLLYYIVGYNAQSSSSVLFGGIALACLLVGFIGFGRIYLGMHSLVDVIGGLIMGVLILVFWIFIYEHVDNFIVSGQNVTAFWATLSFLCLFAYPTPEIQTPSFEYHTAFNGVALGIVSGVQQTYFQFHHDNVPRIFTSQLSYPAFFGRVLIGIPTILVAKYCSKALSKWMLPTVCNTLGIPIRSSCYIPTLKVSEEKSENKQSGYLHKLICFSQESFDVDTGIRFLQYTGLAWSVVDLVPSLFSYVNL